jgi:hypothetical protein
MSEKRVTALLSSHFPMAQVFLVNMNERRIESLDTAEAPGGEPSTGSSIRLAVDAWQVVTLELRPASVAGA